jgi:hypothetical protein
LSLQKLFKLERIIPKIKKKQNEPLVTREELEKFIDNNVELKDYSDFLKNRWLKMVMWWHTQSFC